MAVAIAVPTVTDQWFDTKRQNVVGTLAISASPATYAPGGIVCNFLGKIPSNRIPSFVQINGISGFTYAYVPGTDASNGLVKVFVETAVGTNTPLSEHTTAAIVAGVSGDTITFEAIFKLR